ncbi:GMC family oxidoreductase N-terminal domain-containing protein [Roseiarcaceae bacterium H3SJ34-1]|uniref:GMC family oxidoreductase n=1 Tax=Terripilifer ovatus TaxID=3032367 RepID=UPI003AB94B21|nr:GMC family oxidoreductase N-terminal domain-containing protein [Roseiarcaceae bacterium H3SJ34-1]
MTPSYDYIVIGSGSAGAVIAARLSEDPKVSVLLLEAGGRDRHPFQVMPLAFIKVAKGRFGTWRFETEPEPGLNNRRLEIKRGRTLGGSSSINAMIAIRGNATDYDLWRQQGLDGWSYADVLPYFRKLESSWRGDSEFHGASGPVRISPTVYPEMLFDAHKEAALAAGIPFNDDPNGATQDGLARMEQNTGDGVRASTARAYLYPAMNRPNLTIRTGAPTTRILLEKGRAVGVEYAQGRALEQARAGREVIVSGGAYNSPQILMLSGIGPADHLQSVGIKPLHDLPGVGQNLSEHPNILNIYKARGKVGLTKFLRLDRAAAELAHWYINHGGPFATNGAAANLFLRTREGLDRPDVQCIAMTLSNSAELWFPGATPPPNYCFSIRIGALHPQSRGWVKLRSADPADTPRIFFNMFGETSDLDTMVRGVRACRNLYAQSPLRDMIDRELAPGDAKQSDDEIADFIRANAGHRSHPVSTCRMGMDDTAVVDAQLRVRGIDGLRVADASIMPELPSGNTNLPTIMIGEKAADMIKAAV